MNKLFPQINKVQLKDNYKKYLWESRFLELSE